jgi:hypothetical protein
MLVIVGLVLVAAASAVAAELRPEAARAYDTYVARVQAAFVARAPSELVPVRFGRVRRDGDFDAEPAEQDGIIGVPSGLVHHWAGGTLIGGVSLRQVLDVSMSYGDYHRVYQPIVASRLLDRQGDTFRALFRIREGVSGVSAVLDVRSQIGYVFPRDGRAYVISRAEEIREVVGAGGDDEEYLPAGQDSGYLWRAHTFTIFIERPNGVYVEMETVGLSREFPAMLGWVIEPIARRLGRKSVEASLREFRDAVRSEAHAR